MTNATVDLRSQIGDISSLGVSTEELQYFILEDTSPPRKMMELWSLETGESFHFHDFRVLSLLQTGRWSRNPADAPEIKVSEYPCFLAPESAIRATLDSLGIVQRCKSKHPSKYAMEGVARRKHREQWTAWNAYLSDLAQQKRDAQQQQQVEAMLSLAQNAQPQSRIQNIPLGKVCEKCGEPIEGTDAFAMARHNKTCSAKDGG